MRVGVLSSFPPQLCGIATFSSQLNSALAALGVHLETVVISGLEGPEKDGAVRRDFVSDYAREAERLNSLELDLVLIHHEYGLFGGLYGSYLLTFVGRLKVPIVTVFHTVLPAPDDALREVTTQLAALSQLLIVMCHSAAKLLASDYAINATPVAVVPHGYAEVGIQPRPCEIVRAAGSCGPILLTFGLLGPNKGVELGIAAMTSVLQSFPHAKYFVVGATHPGEIRHGVDDFRAALVSSAREKGVEAAVVFVNKYLALEDHVAWIQHSDLIVMPHRDLRQASSGTLAYAIGAGRPVVCTRFAYALELFNAGAGLILSAPNAMGIASASIGVLADRRLSARLTEQSLAIGASMTWTRIAGHYLAEFARL